MKDEDYKYYKNYHDNLITFLSNEKVSKEWCCKIINEIILLKELLKIG